MNVITLLLLKPVKLDAASCSCTHLEQERKVSALSTDCQEHIESTPQLVEDDFAVALVSEA